MATVASAIPPITARPSGAFCSLPSSIPSDIGIMPAIMAQPVMMMGRSLPLAAVTAARSAGMPSSRRWRSAKLTSMIAFDTATPTAMIAPMNDSMFSVDRVSASATTTPQSTAGTEATAATANRDSWKYAVSMIRITTTATPRPISRDSNMSRMGRTWPRSSTSVPLGGWPARMMAASRRSITRPRSSPSMLAVRLRYRLML